MPLKPEFEKRALEAIQSANSYVIPKKMAVLGHQMQSNFEDIILTEEDKNALFEFISNRIQDWPEEARIIPEDWVFIHFEDSYQDFGVGGDYYESKWTGIRTDQFLLNLGKKVIVHSPEIVKLLEIDEHLEKLADLVANSTIEEIEFQAEVPSYLQYKIGAALNH